jgi:hypothetical protein
MMTTELDTNIYGANDVVSLTLYKRKDGSERVVLDRGGVWLPSSNNDVTIPSEFLTISEYADLLLAAMNGDEPMRKQLQHLKLVYALMK